MANFSVSFSITDEDGDTSTVNVHLVAADIGAAVTKAQSLAGYIDIIVNGYISNVLVSQVVDFSGWGLSTTPGADSDVEVKGRFIFNTAGGYTSRVSLPTFIKQTYTVPGGTIDTTIAAVSNFVSEMENGGWSDSRFADITSLKSAYEAFGR